MRLSQVSSIELFILNELIIEAVISKLVIQNVGNRVQAKYYYFEPSLTRVAQYGDDYSVLRMRLATG